MKTYRKGKLAAAALAAGTAGLAVLAGAAPASAGAPPHGTPAAIGAHRGGVPVLVSCTGQAQIAPRRIVLACADADDYLRHMNWAVWSANALGTGTEWIDDCVPDCAHGTFRHYRVLVTLWRVKSGPAAGQTHFTRLTTIYTHKRPVIGGKAVAFRTWKV
jgi:hypothetical protein